MTDRGRIVVAANDTLERVLERVRAAEGGEVVLDVDERSPLFLSLPQLDSLDDVAREHGVTLAIASTNRTLINTARVFGLQVIETRAVPLPDAAPPGRLIAGQPLGRQEADEEGIEGLPPAPPATTVRLTPAAVVRPGSPMPPADADDAEGWDEPEPPAPAPRAAQGVAPGGGARTARLDPYGQPFPEDDEALDDGDESSPPGRGRTIRSLRQGVIRRAAASEASPAGDGWDDEPGDYEDEEADYARREARPGLLAGVAAFWGDVRAWVDARRGGTPVQRDDADAEFEDDAPSDDGWDEPPYRARQAARQIDVTQGAGDEAEAPPTPVADPVRPARPVIVGRIAEPPVAEGQAARTRPVVAPAPAIADDDDEYEDEVEPDEGWRPRRELRGGAPLAAGGLLVGVLAVALAILLILYIFLPTATVTLVARTGSVPVEFAVVVAEIDPNSPQGQPTKERIVVPARRITVPIGAKSTKPATGARLEPDTVAGGSVVLVNSSREAVTVPKGTTLTAANGQGYITQEGVTIGPADPLAERFGSASVKVAASVRGSGGNAATGAVRGELPNGISYINRNGPIAGGSDKRIQTVAQQDLAAAAAAAQEATRAQGQSAINGALPPGGVVMRDTLGVNNLQTTFDTKEGADGQSVTATVSAEATALVYLPGEVEAAARAEAERRLAGGAPPGSTIVPGSAQIDPPQLAGETPGQLTYKVTATARTRAAIGGDAERDRLARELARKDDDEARAILAALPGVSSVSIAYDTSPFPERMPWLPSHITVRVADER
jgi:hypothetical protein